MALTYVGGNSAAVAGSTTVGASMSLTALTGGSGSTAQTGDIVVVLVGIGSQGVNAPTMSTTGYTTIATLYADDTNDANLLVAYKVMGGTPDTVVDTNPSGNNARALAAAVHVWRGVDTTTPLDVTSTTATGINTGQPTPPAITPVTSGSVIICCGVSGEANPASATFTTATLSNFVANGSSDTNSTNVGIGSFAWSSGTYTPATFGGGSLSSANSWAAVSLALRPLGQNFIPKTNWFM